MRCIRLRFGIVPTKRAVASLRGPFLDPFRSRSVLVREGLARSPADLPDGIPNIPSESSRNYNVLGSPHTHGTIRCKVVEPRTHN